MVVLCKITLEITSAVIPSDNIQECIFLVVPETDYNKTAPLFIGTNILDELLLQCKSKIGENILQNAALHTKIVSELDQEIPQSQTADNPVAPRGRAARPSQDTRKTN